MSDYKGLRWIRSRKDTPHHTYEEFTPSCGWTQDSKFHYLLVDLPAYKSGDIKLQIDKAGTIAISGERLIGDTKQEHFGKAFTLPKDSDTDNISMRFEGETLRVIIPRVAKEVNDKETTQDNVEAPGSDSMDERREEPDESRNDQNVVKAEDSMHHDKSIIWIVFDCKEILLASILSFTLGFLVSQKVHHHPSN